MFGKGKAAQSSNAKFVIAKGRAVGNIMPPKGSENRKGNGTQAKTAPTKADPKSRSTPTLMAATRDYKGKAGPVRIA